VKNFLENSFGSPADLSYDRSTNNLFHHIINRKTNRNEKRSSSPGYGKKVYRETVTILVDEKLMPKDPNKISNKAIQDFNIFVEGYIKSMARIFIFTCEKFGMKRMEAIREFQETFGFSNELFPEENILQDLKRNGSATKKLICKKKN
jgi:hypothetical protein